MRTKFTNFATSTIAGVGGIGAGDLTVNVQPGEGALFPTIVAGEHFYVVMIKTTGAREIAKVTARTTDALTIARAQDNTSALVFAENDKIELRANAAALEEMVAYTDAYLLGYMRRSQFGYVDGDTITVGGGVYEVNGKIAKITSELTTTAHGLTGPLFAYLYIEYASLPIDGVLIQSDLIWASTAPTWSHSKLGWYNGSDRCIFACAIAVTTDDILEFYHVGNYVQWGTAITATNNNSKNITDTFVDAAALTMPKFSTRAQVTTNITWVDGVAVLHIRPNGSAGSGVYCGLASTADTDAVCDMQVDLITDSSHLVEWKDDNQTASLFTLIEQGWFLPEGI